MRKFRPTSAAPSVLAMSLLWTAACGTLRPAPQQPAQESHDYHSAKPTFAYTGDRGPGFWGTLERDWRACSEDTRQSPIDLDGFVPDPALGPLDLATRETGLDMVNKGYTLEQAYVGGGTLRFEGTAYTLQQFHFHTLSEHAVEGGLGEMELHAVFSNAETKTNAVIGVIYRLGAENPFLAKFDRRLPKAAGEVAKDPAVRFDLREAFPDTEAYLTYPGSLTTPPCSPTVTWIVLRQESELSESQLQAFRDIMGNNFRPLQERGRRTIRTSSPPPAP
ncbi:MAG: carbonic anhydrase family protein [Acidobacteria bacterium]|nr:carbonic anhydrase family protein [Acidobacteriota bacterium]